MGIIGILFVGLIVGALARLVMPGEQKMGWILTCLLGIAGSMLAGFVGQQMGWADGGVDRVGVGGGGVVGGDCDAAQEVAAAGSGRHSRMPATGS